MNVRAINNIDETSERRKRKIPASWDGGDIVSTTLSVKDSYRVNSFYAVLDVIILSIKQRFNENNIKVIMLCEKLFLTKVFLNDDELNTLFISTIWIPMT
jgi:hypothetical protein